MFESITKQQIQEIRDAAIFDTDKYHRLLERYTGIEARPYTAYHYFDSGNNYIGDSNENDLPDLLRAAGVEVKK